MRVAPERPDHSEQVGVALSQNPVTAVTASTVTLYSADGLIAVQEEHDGVIADVPQIVSNSAGDDDLTSLTWLHDKNLLKSVPELPKQEFVDGNASDSTLSNCSASSSSSHKTSSQCISVIPRVSYDPQVHVNSKPPFSFSCLIFMAIEDSDDKALPVKDIYVWILNHFPYYRNAPTGWKNSVRHNLSLNKCFKKVDKSPNLGKGSLWMVEQRFRPCLIQALQKTPHHQYQKLIRNLNNNNNSSNKNNSDTKKMTSENVTCDNSMTSRIKVEIETPSLNEITTISSSGSQVVLKESLADDVDAAATAMLVLKHGACAFDIKPENVDFVLSENSNDSLQVQKVDDSNAKSGQANCTNDDHNYGYHNFELKINSASSFEHSAIDDRLSANGHYWNSVREDIEEQRKIVEGADALLNLAGITTCNMRKRSSTIYEQRNLKQQCVEPMPTLRSKSLRKEKATSVNFKESISMHNHLNQMYEDENLDSENNNDNNDDSDSTKCSFNNRIIENKSRTLKSRTTVTSSRRLRKKIEKKRFKM